MIYIKKTLLTVAAAIILFSVTITVAFAKNTSIHVINVPANTTSVRINFYSGQYVYAEKQSSGFWIAQDDGKYVSDSIRSITIVVNRVTFTIPRDLLKIGTEGNGTVKVSLLSFPGSTTTTRAPTTTTTRAPTTSTTKATTTTTTAAPTTVTRTSTTTTTTTVPTTVTTTSGIIIETLTSTVPDIFDPAPTSTATEGTSPTVSTTRPIIIEPETSTVPDIFDPAPTPTVSEEDPASTSSTTAQISVDPSSSTVGGDIATVSETARPDSDSTSPGTGSQSRFAVIPFSVVLLAACGLVSLTIKKKVK